MSADAGDFIYVLRGQRQIFITVTGRRTGRGIALPVWFVQLGRMLYLLPVKGSRTQWLRNLLADPSINIRCRGQCLSAQVRISQDPQEVQQVADRFRAKYRADQVAQYYSNIDACVEVPL